MEIYTERGFNRMYGKGSLQIMKSNYVKLIFIWTSGQRLEAIIFCALKKQIITYHNEDNEANVIG